MFQGVLVYETIGIYPAEAFFGIRTNGSVYTYRSLKDDAIGRESYTLRVTVYDSFNPRRRDTADVLIFVCRNQNAPEWTEFEYSAIVTDNCESLGKPVLQISATDADGDAVSYCMVDDMTYDRLDNMAASEFFYLANDGHIYIQKSIRNAPHITYKFSVCAKDNGLPSRTSYAKVTITVTSAHQPMFVDTPYSTTVQENVDNGTCIFDVMATDPDGMGDIMYEVVGSGPAASFFTVDNHGRICTRGPLYTARNLVYTVCCRVIFNVENTMYAYHHCAIVMHLKQKLCVANKRSLLKKMLTDEHEIENIKLLCLIGFSVIECQRLIFLPLFIFCVFQLCVVAYDSTSSCQRAQACVSINVLRNINPPTFNPDHYYTRVSECTAVGTSLISVTASDLDLKDNVSQKYNVYPRIYYGIVI
ncbi:FAT2-like protein [Mya arenaria]|uniref:FAT2-like protein n=1 Tax=Mya arenaria TaxID=6604 RepID=A0ABY7DI89_MYAAR|nr:FAT2-like protein [Mya arenaria]